MIPYTYYIKHLPTGLKYYGSKYGKGSDPAKFWVPNGYFTSSNYVKELIKEYGIETFKVKVTKTFATSEEALAHEYRFIQRVDAVKRTDWLNKNNGGKHFYNVGPDSEETKRKKSAAPRSVESNLKRSMTLKNKPKHPNFGFLLSQAQKLRPKVKEQLRREKIKNKALGRGHTQKTIDILSEIVSNTRWIKKDEIQKKINVEELETYISQGWVNGRILSTITCPHCGITGVKYNIVRNHFNKCKKLLSKKED